MHSVSQQCRTALFAKLSVILRFRNKFLGNYLKIKNPQRVGCHVTSFAELSQSGGLLHTKAHFSIWIVKMGG